MDRLIRARAGRLPAEPQPEPGEEPRQEEPPKQATDEEHRQLWSLGAAGSVFPTEAGVEWAVKRLKGWTREALHQEAAELLQICRDYGIDPADPERRAHRTTADGGVRGVLPDQEPPSVDSLIRAAARDKRREVWAEARSIDASRSNTNTDQEKDR